jgi:hypothetical protein
MLTLFVYDEDKEPSQRTPLHVELDSSNRAWAAVYYQVNSKGERKINRFDRGLFKTHSEQTETATEQEFRAVMNTLEPKHRHMTVSRTMFVHSDHKALSYYLEDRVITPKAHHWRKGS